MISCGDFKWSLLLGWWSCCHWTNSRNSDDLCYGPLARYVKLRVAHAPGMPGTFTPPPRASNPDMHQGTCVTHVPWCMPGSLTSSFYWSRWLGKRSRHSRRMRNPQFYVSGKRPMKLPWRHCDGYGGRPYYAHPIKSVYPILGPLYMVSLKFNPCRDKYTVLPTLPNAMSRVR